jgi:hypothetical protein
MATWQFPPEVNDWIAPLAFLLDARNREHLKLLFLGLLFARGRRTITSWLRAVGIRKGYEEQYYFLSSLGGKCKRLAGVLLHLIIRRLPISERILLALDDTPTKRYGPHVEGAGIHHNPTPGPAGQKFLYGHVWVTLAWVIKHPLWGAIALPLLARMYVRKNDLPALQGRCNWKFRTKLELAAGLVKWAAKHLRSLGIVLWVVVDGGYVKRPFLGPVMAAGVTIVGRLRKDAALRSVPQISKRGQRGRGRPRIYGEERIDLAKRAGQKRGWLRGTFSLYGQLVDTTYKTFLATYPPVGGLIRVVLVKQDNGWLAFFCTDPDASVADILGAVADRSALEQVFHDVKEVHGAGQPQLRNLWSNIAAWHMSLWLYTLVELWSWDRPQSSLSDRSDSPWDDPDRRPSHADRCKSLRRECLRTEFSRLADALPEAGKLRQFVQRLLQRAV